MIFKSWISKMKNTKRWFSKNSLFSIAIINLLFLHITTMKKNSKQLDGSIFDSSSEEYAYSIFRISHPNSRFHSLVRTSTTYLWKRPTAFWRKAKNDEHRFDCRNNPTSIIKKRPSQNSLDSPSIIDVYQVKSSFSETTSEGDSLLKTNSSILSNNS